MFESRLVLAHPSVLVNSVVCAHYFSFLNAFSSPPAKEEIDDHLYLSVIGVRHTQEFTSVNSASVVVVFRPILCTKGNESL